MGKCQACGCNCPDDDLRDYAGRELCEDCYMDALSPARSCDPWASYTATRLEAIHEQGSGLTPIQKKIMELVGNAGGITRTELAARLGMRHQDLMRDIAALKHMNKIKGRPATPEPEIIPAETRH